MPCLGRREFCGLSGIATASVRLAGAARPMVVGAQLYTLRDVLPKDPLGILRRLENIGYREAELTADTLERTFAAIKQTSIKPVSLHLDPTLFAGNRSRLPAALDDAANRGVAFAVCPYVAPADRGGAETMKRLGAILNQAGRMCRSRGIRFGYHNHAFEFAPAGAGTLLDALLQATDRDLVGLELDIMWARVAGLNPAAVVDRYGSRVELLHLKNVAALPAKRYDEDVPKSAYRDVGDGVIDIAGVLSAAAKAGVKHYFVEQDQTQGDPLAALGASYRFLEKLNR